VRLGALNANVHIPTTVAANSNFSRWGVPTYAAPPTFHLTCPRNTVQLQHIQLLICIYLLPILRLAPHSYLRSTRFRSLLRMLQHLP